MYIEHWCVMFALSRSKMSLLGFGSPRVKAQVSIPNEHSFVIVVIFSILFGLN